MNVMLRVNENASNAALGQIVDLNLKRIVQLPTMHRPRSQQAMKS